MKVNLLNLKILFIILILLISFNIYGKQEYLRIHFIDVGEGDSIFIEFPDEKNILIDTGNAVTGINVYNYLKKLKIKKIDHLIITHPHPDHFGGMFALTQLYEVQHFYDNNENINEEINKNDFYRWYNDQFRLDKRYKVLKKGSILKFDKVKLEILWPGDVLNEDWNANCLVIMVKYLNFKALLMGDANKITEKEFLKMDLDVQANILKAGHHGAYDTGLEEFIKKVNPEIVIVSVNKNNIRNYPSEDVVNKYIESGAKVYKTSEYGTIIFKVNNIGKYFLNFWRN